MCAVTEKILPVCGFLVSVVSLVLFICMLMFIYHFHYITVSYLLMTDIQDYILKMLI